MLISKSKLRRKIKLLRKNIVNKEDKDVRIANNLFNLDDFKSADTVICYASFDDEIVTDDIMKYCFDNNKKVALPYCIDNEGNMEFYYINSLEDDLVLGSFDIREPNIEKCEKATDFSNAICVVPGLCFDKKGNRLGYGKGYYDRFLQNFTFKSVGLCYNTFVLDEIPVNVFDRQVDYVVTENNVISINNGGSDEKA